MDWISFVIGALFGFLAVVGFLRVTKNAKPGSKRAAVRKALISDGGGGGGGDDGDSPPNRKPITILPCAAATGPRQGHAAGEHQALFRQGQQQLYAAVHGTETRRLPFPCRIVIFAPS